MSVSVCIPTFRRPEMLRACVESCFDNNTRPLEIVVSDDDADPAVQAMLEAMTSPEGIAIVYTANRLGKGQAANVNSAFQTATQSRLVLMHDDDLFLPGGIDALAKLWDNVNGNPDAVYGRQRIVDAEGIEIIDATHANDEAYHKLKPTGIQRSPLWAALMQQFPNNGYMVSRGLALEVGYPAETEVGREPVDFHFGLRYALSSKNGFWMISDYVSCYQLSENSIARGEGRKEKTDGHLGFEVLQAARKRTDAEHAAFSHALNRYAAAAVVGYLELRKPRRAAQVLQSYPNTNISNLGRLRLFFATGLMILGLEKASDWVRTWQGARRKGNG